MFRIEKERAYIAFLALISTTPPLSTDMYLAAIPRIATQWGVGKDLVNLSLVLWFVSFSVSMLVMGRIADMRGRRPVLLGGLALFVLSSFLCATSPNVWLLIVFRIFQGLGSAAPSAMAVTISRDRFAGPERQQVLAYVGIIMAVAPMVSPMIGAMLLKLGSWRFIFVVQGLLGCVSLVVSLGYAETVPELSPGGFFRIFERYARLFRNREYLWTNTVMGLIPAPFYGFIAFSPIAYIMHYGLDEKVFSLLFGANALAAMMGAYACTYMSRRLSAAGLLTLGFAVCFASGVGLLLFAGRAYLALTGFMAVLSFSIGMSRPVSTSLILEQVDTDIGAASSFAVFYQFMAGAVIMAVVTQDWARPFLVFSGIAAGAPLTVLLVWLKLKGMLEANGSLARLDTSKTLGKR